MFKNILRTAAMLAAFLFSISLSAQVATTNEYTTADIPGASYTYGLQQNATHPIQMLNGQPPIGYAGATGTYIPVQATSGLELPVRFLGAIPIYESATASKITGYATETLTVGDTSQAISIATNCANIYFQNQGTETVTISPGATAVYGSGFLVYPQGFLPMTNIPDGSSFSTIANTGATSTVFIFQEIKE